MSVPVATKACVACGKLIATSFQKCNFCSAAQPTAQPAAQKETRCTTCKRPYSAKLEACPFCARDRAAGVDPAAFGATRTRRSLRPLGLNETPVEAEYDEPRKISSALILGLPLALGAVWGIAELVWTTTLGGREASAAMGPSIAVALFIAPAMAALFVRRTYGSFATAIEEVGLSKVLVLGFAASAIALFPTALTVTGFIHGINALGADSRTQNVECKVGSVWQRAGKSGDTGWQMSYSCDVEGEHLTGTIGPLPARPEAVEGGAVTFRAARGRFGYWLRYGGPMAAATPPAVP